MVFPAVVMEAKERAPGGVGQEGERWPIHFREAMLAHGSRSGVQYGLQTNGRDHDH